MAVFCLVTGDCPWIIERKVVAHFLSKEHLPPARENKERVQLNTIWNNVVVMPPMMDRGAFCARSAGQVKGKINAEKLYFQLTFILPIMERLLLYFWDGEAHILSDKLKAEIKYLNIFQWRKITEIQIHFSGAHGSNSVTVLVTKHLRIIILCPSFLFSGRLIISKF